MPFDSDTSVQDSFTNDCELTQDDLAVVSGGKPKNPPPKREYVQIELMNVAITSY